MRERKAEEVLTSARALFLEKGFDGTSVDDIALRAHVSKATVYNNFPDKATVLTALLDRVATESATILAAVVAPLTEPGDVEARLERTAIALARGVLRPEVLQLRRLAIAESVRFPGAVAGYFEHGPGSTLRLLADALGTLDRQGRLSVPDPELAAAELAYAAVGALQDRALLTGEQPTPATVERFAGGAARDFVRAHRPEREVGPGDR
jgi:TetR/AcrR family transcriptional regulator, mexJK operon transcriptional repressor